MLNRHICPASTLSKPTRLVKAHVASTYRPLSLVKPFRPSQPCFQLLPNTASRKANRVSLRNSSSFALHSQPSSNFLPDVDPDTPPELSDNEWEIRAGRAIFVLQETLPEFFDTGLITSINKDSGIPRPPASTPIANINFPEQYSLQDDDEPIYSPNIRLSYTPPLELPAPFPKTFHIDGIQLYVASSGIVRHTMNALYSDLTVELTKMAVHAPSSPSASESDSTTKKRNPREKSIIIRQAVAGIARVSRKPAEWEIESTYTFSPITGLIHEHVVNSIHPAPHQAVYDSLHSTLGKLLGWGAGPRPNLPNGAAFKDSTPSGKSG